MTFIQWAGIITLGVSLASLVFLAFAAALASRPDKVKKRGAEFGSYALVIALLTALGVPAASVVLTQPVMDGLNIFLPLVKTLVYSLAVVRAGVLMLKWYGQRNACDEHVNIIAQDNLVLTQENTELRAHVAALEGRNTRV